ncbi:MAG: bifunctional heptose 7-phosphate kinase/heptose 1-phosphate adenyltransferase [Candidatus Thorarchaeota archaeon]
MKAKDIEKLKILVVGDIMLDKYVVGDVSRISPEAPVPIVNVLEEYYTLGGSGNVVRNIRELGAQVDCLASIGNDLSGNTIKKELIDIGVGDLTFFGSETTIIKERIIADHRLVQMLRIDREIKKTVDPKEAIKILEKKSKNDYDMIVISDYAKGMLTNELLNFLKENINAHIIIDPKPENAWMYNDVLMITPNETEWMHMKLSSRPGLRNIKYVLQTMGKKGMKLYENKKEWFIEAEPVDIYNVSGAGDTVVSVMTVCLSLGISVEKSAEIANKCAGYVVTQPGTSVVPLSKFEEILDLVI